MFGEIVPYHHDKQYTPGHQNSRFCVLTELQLLCRTKMKKVMCAAGRGEGQHGTRARCPTVSTNHTNSE